MFFKIKTAYAHCDIPCGIYDPHNAQMGAHTVLRMTKLLLDLNEKDDKKADHQIVRLTRVKEEHAELVKREVTILWGDYFKEEHFKEQPGLSDLVNQTLKLASKAKQNIDIEIAKQLLKNTQDIASIFYNSKGLTPKKVKAPYPTEEDLIVYSE